MNVEGVSPPTPFLARPGKPALPWSDWIFSFHNYLTALGGEAYSTERKTALLLHCVGAEAQRVYRTLPVQPRREDEDEFHAAERQLAEFYEPQVNVIAERFFFRQRRQESHEPTADYVAALRRLAVNCSFGQMTDAMIRDQVVEATVHPILRERFLQDKGLTLDRVLEIAEAFERSRREATAMAGPARPAADGAQSLHQISDARQRRGRRPWRPARRQDDRRPAPAQLQADRRPGPAQLQPDTCPSCGRRQHNERGRCPATGATCRQCGRTGHFAVVCWSGERNDDRRCHELTVLCCAVPNTDKMMCEVQMEVPGITQTVNLQVDTGATVSALGLGIARRLFKGSRLNRTSARLFGFGRHQLQVLGTLPALVTYRGRRANTEFFIIDSDGEEAVMGLDLLKQLDVNLHPASGAIDQLAVTGSAEVPEPPPSQPDPGEICSLTMVRGHPEEADLHEDSSAEEEVIALLTDEESVLTEQDVRTASAADPELQQLRHQIKRGWPSSAKACPVEVQPYFKMRHELWVRNDDVILRGAQQQSNKRSYDRRRGVTTPRITEGDYVCVRRQGHRSKTSCRCTSPVRVTGRVGPATYRLADGRTWNAAHLARLPYAPASPSASPPAGPGETTSTATTSEADAAGPLTSFAAASRPSTETACEPSPDAADVSVQRPRRSDRVCRRPDYYVSQ
ncbi:hypothetical protein FJT64_012003 [Amphibalanus amphitrite]|uniref:CCHC-type domain-containing protein n=1 Tax=Amphibalanus amphitrite TaxID=1232801 RepID=A0A6A4VGW1_AMPAM|nr:hypothetical protein FJT64_012003 [Amphibalanus amphitrite]